MLSNIEVILLSIVNEKPSHAYEIDKTIEAREMRKWVRIGVASVYQVMERLEKGGYVHSKKEKEGRMPVRKRYYITGAGKKALAETSKKLLADLEWYYLDLNVGLETSDLLTREEMSECLKKRLDRVASNITKLKELAENGGAFKRKAVIGNLLCFREAEKKYLENLIEDLHTD
ncbi:MAG: PadR family transcriptional regulator [Bacillota bacterium]